MKIKIAVIFLAVSCTTIAKELPKNIIMIVADGMGPAYTTAYRYFSDIKDTNRINKTVFDRNFKGLSSTYPARASGVITDSAAGATALSTGKKTYNGAIAVDINKQPLETVLERAKAKGKRIGVVVTSQINHATPAAYLSHNESRQNYNDIADSYIDAGIKADLLFGGGWKYFIRQKRNLVNEFKQKGFHYIDNYQQLNSIPSNTPVLGLFANEGLPWALDDSERNRLSMLTKVATQHLENDNGYFLLIEASQTDWGGHKNDIAAIMGEMADLAYTMEYFESYIQKHPNTLVILTADHNTGGLSIGANGIYEWRPELLLELNMSPEAAAKKLASSEITKENFIKLLNFTPSSAELEILSMAKVGAIKSNEKHATSESKNEGNRAAVDKALYKSLKQIIDVRTNTGWTTGAHTGIDVPIYVMGMNSDDFSGHLDNTDIGAKIFQLLGD